MMYLDASALVPMIVTEASTSRADQFKDEFSKTLIVSDFARSEVSATLGRLVRTGILTSDEADRRWEEFDLWASFDIESVECTSADLRVATLYTRRVELALRLPDAIHLAICKRAAHVLVTLDKRLKNAAEVIGIPVRAFA